VPDTVLADEGLRGEVRSVHLPAPDAAGDLELEGIRCVLRRRPILDVDRLAFRRGEVTAVRGVNGAGKSTLARVIAGLQSAQGAVRLDGHVLRRRQRQRATAIVMQDVQRQLFAASVQEELALAVHADETALRDVLDRLDLAHLAERHPLSLSGGQQQRLIVAAARLSGRPIVMFDEPSSGVDRRHLASISEMIRAVADGGAVVLLISHDDDLLALAADREVVLHPRSHAEPVTAPSSTHRSTAASAGSG
jgi:energy-coupling factor transport system ATP-binding protein